jgi:hypothetical protein
MTERALYQITQEIHISPVYLYFGGTVRACTVSHETPGLNFHRVIACIKMFLMFLSGNTSNYCNGTLNKLLLPPSKSFQIII